MNQALQLGIHRPGTTPMHRLPAGAKLLGLIALSLTIVAVRSVTAALVFAVVALTLALLTRVRLRDLARALRYVLVIAVVAGALQWWWYGRDKAVETMVDLMSLTVLAVTVSTSTAVNAMVDALVRVVRPLRRFGVDPDRVALVLALAVQALPTTIAVALETRDAARARGLRNPRAYLTPFVIRVVARAHETGEALHARGVADADPGGPSGA